MADHHDLNRPMGFEERMGFEQQPPDTVWAWVAGGIAVAVLVVLMLVAGTPTETAGNNPATPPETTGVAPTPTLTTPPRLPQPTPPSTAR
jgi:hypothetical protein